MDLRRLDSFVYGLDDPILVLVENLLIHRFGYSAVDRPVRFPGAVAGLLEDGYFKGWNS